MLGIKDIGVYWPQTKISNRDLLEKFGIDERFLSEKIGVLSRRIKGRQEETSDLCVGAIKQLCVQSGLASDKVGVLVVVTQNPDMALPHTSAIVHGKIGLPPGCACFDVSLGCSGYVYGLSIVQSFMQSNGIENGLLVTSDPYSKIIDPDDKNTALLFGDAASATWIGRHPQLSALGFTFGTLGSEHEALICKGGKLMMDGRKVFNFVMKNVPTDIGTALKKAGVDITEVDMFILHQGSRYILDSLATAMKLDKSKVEYDMAEYGNTVSSSIPIILKKTLDQEQIGTYVLSGFGVGLSLASTVLRRNT